MIVDSCCNSIFEEVVDLAEDTKMTAETHFNNQDKNITTAARIVRPLGILLTILGIFMLFMPIIALLNWIPLVGTLLSFTAGFAAFLFALIVGAVISCLVIAIAWVLYRPLIGVSLILLVSISLYFIFFFPRSAEAAAVEIGDVKIIPDNDIVNPDGSSTVV